MNKLGGWEINVSTKIPEKIATAATKANNIFGCIYEPCLYIGSQVANGTNHAILMSQTVLNGKDSKNVAVAVFNEKPDTNDISLIDIHRIVESGGPFGGKKIDITVDIPEDLQNILRSVTANFLGNDIKAYAYIGSQVTTGINYIFFGTVAPVIPDAVPEAAIITVNDMQCKLMLERVFEPGKNDKLSYAFSW